MAFYTLLKESYLINSDKQFLPLKATQGDHCLYFSDNEKVFVIFFCQAFLEREIIQPE